MKSYEDTCRLVVELVKDVSQFVMAEYHKLSTSDIVHKAKNDLVSYVDIGTEKRLVEGLSQILPGSEFLAEEDHNTLENPRGKTFWIIDPIDGTTNYIYKIPAFCMSVALWDKDEIKLGVVYDPMHDECFYAWEGGGAWCNNSPVKINQTALLQNALLATGFPYNRFEKLDEIVSILKLFLLKSQDVRRLGAAALDLCYVACGRFDGFWEFYLKPWDVAAASLIVQEAGGKVSDFKGGENYLFTGEIVAANAELITQMNEQIIQVLPQ